MAEKMTPIIKTTDLITEPFTNERLSILTCPIENCTYMASKEGNSRPVKIAGFCIGGLGTRRCIKTS